MTAQSRLLTTLFFLAPAMLLGQQSKPSKPVPLLPEIDPQDIEIRGNYRPQFSGLRRQPVLGFNPVSPVFSQEGSRIPFIETPDQVAAGTTLSLLERPPQPPVALRDVSNRGKGYLESGFGNLITPSFRGVYDSGGEINSILTDVSWLSSDGHLASRNTAFRLADARAEWIYRPLVDTDWRTGVQVSSRYLNLYSPATSLNPLASQQRTLSGASAFGEYRFMRGMYRRLTVTARAGFDEAALQNAPENERGAHLSIGLSGRKAAAETERWFEYEGNVRGFMPSGDAGLQHWYLVDATGRYAARLENGLQWKAGARLVMGTDEIGARYYLMPDWELRFTDPDWLDLRFRGSGTGSNLTLAEALQQQFYLKQLNTLANQYGYNAALELAVRPSRLFSLHAALSADHFWRYRYVTRNAARSTGPALLTDYTFAMARNVQRYRPSAGVKIWLEESGLVWYNEMYWQHFEAGSLRVPYQEDFGFLSDVSWQFLRQWFGQLTLRYVSDRRDVAPPVSVDGFLLLDARLEYRLDARYGFFASGLNLLNSRYAWITGYTERPRQVLAGVTVRL